MKKAAIRSDMTGLLTTSIFLLALGLCWFSSCIPEAKPLRARRDAILLKLKATASDVNTYQKTHGALPESRKGTLIPNEGYRLVVASDGSSFLVIADRVFVDDTDSRFHFACDQKLQIQKLPALVDAGREKGIAPRSLAREED